MSDEREQTFEADLTLVHSEVCGCGWETPSTLRCDEVRKIVRAAHEREVEAAMNEALDARRTLQQEVASHERDLRRREAETRQNGGNIIRDMAAQVIGDTDATRATVRMVLEMAERKVRRGTYSEHDERRALDAEKESR